MSKEQKLQTEQFEAYGTYHYEYTSGAGGVQPPAGEKRKGSFLYKILTVLCVLTLAVIVFQVSVFRLQAVYVVGCESKMPEYVVNLSGLMRGRNMITITEQEVQRAISKDHTLIFRGMQKDYPGSIYLFVEERKVAAAAQILGVMYMLDYEGIVMSKKTVNLDSEGYPEVVGFPDKDAMVGKVVPTKSAEQLRAYQEIMNELKLQMYLDQVVKIDITDVNSLFLVNSEKINVRLGNADDMRAKIGALRTNMGYLRQLGAMGGNMDVTTPENGKYAP